jgi:hypothetical protein
MRAYPPLSANTLNTVASAASAPAPRKHRSRQQRSAAQHSHSGWIGSWDEAVLRYERAVALAPGWSEGVYRMAYLRRHAAQRLCVQAGRASSAQLSSAAVVTRGC